MKYSKKTGVIFNIQKFSLNDGPGIRTVVFFKGCPLKCRWCSNPESQSSKIQILWDSEKCLQCQKCLSTCPANAVSYADENIHINNSLCNACLSCVKYCPGHALKQEGEEKTVEQILNVCLQDMDFYKESHGGVTLSGGEAMMQHKFAIELLKELKAHHIHTSIETTGYAKPEIFCSVIEHLDLLLFDMKHWDKKMHMEGTGVSNTLIIQNMKYAISSGKKVLPRIPVIPNFNNHPKDAIGFIRLLKEVGANEAQLLPFHQFGEKKYDMLGKDYFYTDVPALHEEELQEFVKIFKENGIHVFF